jgi:hypothetical protein
MQGSGAQAPTLDVGQSAALLNRQLEIQRQNLPQTAQTAGNAFRSEAARNVGFGLGMLVDPAQTIYGTQIDDANATIRALQDAKVTGKGAKATIKVDGKKISVAERDRRIAQAQGTISRYSNRDPIADLTNAFSAEFAQRDKLIGQMEAADPSTPEYLRLQENLSEGGELGRRLMSEAMNRSERGFGVLSPQAERDATQQARAAMAARGMATGSAGIGAELLNRDRYQRARAAEDINFVGGVMNDQRNRFGQSAGLADQERMRQLTLGQDVYNFRLGTNPRMMLAGLGSPYANMTPNAMQMVGSSQGLQPMYSGGQFSGQGGGFNMAGAGMGALSGAASGAMIGSVVPGIGTAVGAIGGGLIGGLGGGLSDEREKTDIKKIDGPTNVIGIPSYEYRYKGEKKKRRGVMAQDVQKVLPEAVAEVDYKGKKRLAIKPAVIGAALAEHLAADTKPVALAS